MSVQVFQCKSCQAPIAYRADLGLWKCDYCQSEFSEDALGQPTEQPPAEDAAALDEYHCSVCGAQLLCEPQTAATFCLYCKSPTIVKSRFEGQFRPRWVIPFAITPAKAQKIYFGYIKGHFFAPRSMKEAREVQNVRALYAPFWLFDCRMEGSLEGEAKTSRRYTSGGYNVTETKHYHVKRSGTAEYDRIPVDGSAHLDNSQMQAIEPYDYAALTDFRMAYMSGVLAERFDVAQEEAASTMRSRAESYLAQSLGEHIAQKYDSFDAASRNIVATSQEASYAMLPVYILTSLHNDKKYTFLVNGQTGKIFGDPPVDSTRRWATISLLFLAAWILLVLVGGFLNAD